MRKTTNQIYLSMAAFVLLMFLNVCAFAQHAKLSGDGSDNPPGNNPHSFIGAWIVQAQITDCSGTITEGFAKLVSINAGGTTQEVSSSSLFRSTSLGVWQHVDQRDFVYAQRFFRFNPDGTPVGSVRAKWTVLMAEDGDAYTATGAIQIVLPNGIVVPRCGVETGTRMTIPE